MEYSHWKLFSDERRINHLIYFSHLFNAIIKYLIENGMFLLQNCMFLPVGIALSPTDKQGPKGPEQEAENVTGKAEEKKASSCLAGLWQC